MTKMANTQTKKKIDDREMLNHRMSYFFCISFC
jgi:hypothetical protein